VVERARIVLLSADGMTGREISARVGCSEQTVVAWRARYTKEGLAGLDERPRCGRPRKVNADKRAQILAATLKPPPEELGVTHPGCAESSAEAARPGLGCFL
jgi:transposase